MTMAPDDRLLVMHFGGIGDVLLATPALQALRAYLPQGQIHLLIAAHAAQLLDGCPAVDAQWVLASTRQGRRWWSQYPQDRRTLAQLREQRFALAINLYPTVSWAGSLRLTTYLCRIQPRRSLGYTTRGRGWCYTERVPLSVEERERTHAAQQALRLARLLGAPDVPLQPHVWITPTERQAAQRQLNAWGLQPAEPLICLSPGALRAEKRWRLERFVALGRWLVEHHRARLIIVGDAADRASAAALCEQLPPYVMNAVGETSLRELVALISLARLVVTLDTGTMHIAAALKRPLVALIGPTNLTRFGPLGDPRLQRVLQPPSHRLSDLSVTEAQRAVEDLMTLAP